MDIKNTILNLINQGKSVKTAEIVKISGFSRAYISRTLKELQEEGKIMLVGKANQAKYIKAEKKKLAQEMGKILEIRKKIANKNISEDLILTDIQKNSGVFLNLSENIKRIIEYAFTEMLNNAIEHSQSKMIEIFMKKYEDTVSFDIVDRGVGIFRNIQKKKSLSGELEAIQDLLKGKQTTMPERHSGEGIFFTSKAADILTIKSFSKSLIFNNIVEDVFVKDSKEFPGTRVSFSISEKSGKDLKVIFDKYTDESYEFSKTRVLVKLQKMDSEYISRSQARRIMVGLDNFKVIALDFRGVDTVGQAFADEIFRVWHNKYPQIEIISENTNENIDFMIARSQGGHYPESQK